MSACNDIPLDRLQRWMQTVVTHPAGIISGAGSPEARKEIDAPADRIDGVVSRSQALTAVERLEIYHRAYFSRLLECLREEFSVLAAALGENLFDTFALGYLQAHPPTSYTLAALGAKFPAYLAESRPAEGDADETAVDWPEFMVDLARLERIVNEVFDGPGVEGQPVLSPERFSSISPDRWPTARVVCAACLRLLKLSYPVNDCFAAIRQGQPWEIPEPAPSYMAVSRREYRVCRFPLGAAQYELLSALSAGESLGNAVERASRFATLTDDQFAAALRQWFSSWATAGFFQEIEV